MGKRIGKMMSLGAILAFSIVFGGCGRSETEARTDTSPSDPAESYDANAGMTSGWNENLQPVAVFEDVPVALEDVQQHQLMGENLYYSKISWNEQADDRSFRLCRKSLSAGAEEEILAEEKIGELHFLYHFLDAKENLYLYGYEENAGEQERYFLRKTDKEKNLIWETAIEEEIPDEDKGNVKMGMADGEGNIALGTYDGRMYLFDAQGAYKASLESELKESGTSTASGILDGGDGLYFYQQEDEWGVFQKIDMEKTALSAVKEIQLMESLDNIKLFSGFEKGILVCENNRLWSLNPLTEEKRELINWQGTTVNIEGNMVEGLAFLENGQVRVLLYDYFTGVSELAVITYSDKGAIPEKQIVTLATTRGYSGGLEDKIKEFNRNSLEFTVELKEYEHIGKLYEELLYGRAPDLMDISNMPKGNLVNKGVLEDLTPYFAASEVVKKEDILDPVLEAGSESGKIVGVIDSFGISHLLIAPGLAEGPELSTEDFLKMGQNGYLIRNATPTGVLDMVLKTELYSYVDWEKKECSFHNEEFAGLLTAVSRCSYPTQTDTIVSGQVFTMEEWIEDFVAGEYLTEIGNVGSPHGYMNDLELYGPDVTWTGYPNREGEPWYGLTYDQMFGICSEGACKEGAWAFLEYFLSAQEQDWYGFENSRFPVRKDSFETYLNRPYYSDMSRFLNPPENPSPEQIEILRNMVKHVHEFQVDYADEIYAIVYEEAQAFFAGDKSAEETAKIIQNRVQLYLDEQ